MEITPVLTPDQSKYLDELMKRQGEMEKKKTQELDQDAFMTILTTQLAHQDPLSPMDNKDFIAQMSQFASLEKLTSMNQYLQKSAENAETSASKLDSLDGMLEALKANTAAIETMKADQSEMKATHVEILNELIKLNQSLGAYDG